MSPAHCRCSDLEQTEHEYVGSIGEMILQSVCIHLTKSRSLSCSASSIESDEFG